MLVFASISMALSDLGKGGNGMSLLPCSSYALVSLVFVDVFSEQHRYTYLCYLASPYSSVVSYLCAGLGYLPLYQIMVPNQRHKEDALVLVITPYS